MQVIYDSAVAKGRPSMMRGKHDGTARIWTVKIKREGIPVELVFRPKGKVFIRDLAKMIDLHLEVECYRYDAPKEGRTYWVAIAR